MNHLDELYALASGQLKRNVRLAYINTDSNSILDGFLVWFEMALDDEQCIVVSTDPFRDASLAEQPSCWESAIFRLKHRFTNSQKLQNLNVTISAQNGLLKIDHYYDAYGRFAFVIDSCC